MWQWKTLGRETVFQAMPFLEVIKEKVEIAPGKVVDDFYQVHLRSFVVCVPILENGNVLVIRQYKHGPRKVSITFPAGFRERDEAPVDACSRELLEETGFQAGTLDHLGEYTDNGNQRGCKGDFFLARNCSYKQPPNSGDLEEMQILELTPGELDTALFDGRIAITHHGFAWALARQWLARE